VSIPLTVSAEWLNERIYDDTIKVVDASWHLPPTGIVGKDEHVKARIPGAVYFDIDACATQSDLPHTLPDADQFARYVGELGISNNHHVIVYDASGWFSSARVWWMFRHFGLASVSVLDGGFAAWKEKSLPLESGDVDPAHAVFKAAKTNDKRFKTANSNQVLEASNSESVLVLDARPASRFYAIEKEFRPGLRSGHIPNSKNLPFPELVENGYLKSDNELKEIFASAGFESDVPVITSCGSGVTAAILILALEKIGGQDLSLYDGSWSEWGSLEHLPVEPAVE